MIYPRESTISCRNIFPNNRKNSNFTSVNRQSTADNTNDGYALADYSFKSDAQLESGVTVY